MWDDTRVTIINQPVETRAETEQKASSISDDITVFLSNSSEVALCLEVKGSPKPFVNFHPENVFKKKLISSNFNDSW